MSGDKLKFSGTILGALGNGFFSVGVDLENGSDLKQTICQLSGKMRIRTIKVVEGDRVDVELDPYDMSKGRIVRRN